MDSNGPWDRAQAEPGERGRHVESVGSDGGVYRYQVEASEG
jgi:hypothetical protein